MDSTPTPPITRPPTPTPTPLRPVKDTITPLKLLPDDIWTGTPFDETDDLALYFDSTVNGDIYDKKTHELVCTSGRQHIVVRGIGNIHEKVSETFPCFDGTLIRAFCFKGKWHLSTRKKINAFNSHWTQSQSFGELFEEISKVKMECMNYSLNERFAYSFLLLSPKVTNVLFNQFPELLFISAYDRKKQVWEQTRGETFPTLVCQRPPFAKRVVKSDTLPRFDPELAAPKTPEEKLINENLLLEKTIMNPTRNQRGLLFIGKSGRLYRQDYQKYRNWQRIINERPLHIVFFEQMKKAVKKDPSCVLAEFYQHYPTFSMKGMMFEMCVRVLRYEFFSNGGLPKPLPPLLLTLFLAVRERNKLPIPSFEFIRRTVAFQKYNLLTELFFNEEGSVTRHFVHEHRNRYTELERHIPLKSQKDERDTSTHFLEPIDDYEGNGTSPLSGNTLSDDDGIVVVGVEDVNEGGIEPIGPDVSEGDADWGDVD